MTDSPFHRGEHVVQERLGVRDSIEPWARKVIRPYLPAEHRAFYEAMPYVVAAARDEKGWPWATILSGGPDFIRSPDEKTLVIGAEPVPGDALSGCFKPGADIGMLGIELSTRRRNRVNGRVRGGGDSGIVVGVHQAFGNCPQHISEREWRRVAPKGSGPAPLRSDRLTTRSAEQIRAADTFFIATGHRDLGDDVSFGMDASHRGGAPGFVEVESDRSLVFPDYAGNNHFNTLGNLAVDARAGLLFVDFEGGGLLQLTGRAEIDWDSPEIARFKGARRLIRFVIEAVISLDDALPLRWEIATRSERLLRVAEKTRESEDVVSFVFEAEDGQGLPDFSPGQHLPIAIPLPGHGELLKRTYSLSNASGENRYRISVKREPMGAVSRQLHDSIEVGDLISSRPAAGEFVLDHGDRPVVLVSAGIGVTPMVSMLHGLLGSGAERPTWFVHGARDGSHHALAQEVRALVGSSEAIRAHVSFSQPQAEELVGRDFDRAGRIDGALLDSLLSDLDAEFYLCGPIAFMAALQQDLEDLGVPTEQIHSESFGPA